MADLREEQILVKVLALLKLTTTAGGNAERDRDAPVDSDNSLTLEQGADDPLDTQGNVLVNSKLAISVIAGVRKNDTYSTQLSLIKKEVYAALMADPQNIGLPDIVSDIMYVGSDKPEVDGDNDKTIMKRSINFDIYYQHSLTDASA
ncbi:MAG: hypothetical protein OEX07_09655 [Gammaproteobacteria bacterium]|nr:hypothetical protein [Gammaproteobacteria bacterium]